MSCIANRFNRRSVSVLLTHSTLTQERHIGRGMGAVPTARLRLSSNAKASRQRALTKGRLLPETATLTATPRVTPSEGQTSL